MKVIRLNKEVFAVRLEQGWLGTDLSLRDTYCADCRFSTKEAAFEAAEQYAGYWLKHTIGYEEEWVEPKQYSLEERLRIESLQIRMNEIKGLSSRAYVKYTPAENAFIKVSLADGKSVEEIAEVLQRSQSAVQSQINKLL